MDPLRKLYRISTDKRQDKRQDKRNDKQMPEVFDATSFPNFGCQRVQKLRLSKLYVGGPPSA